ncbi:Glutathione S-transferase T3-like isoform X1 [Phytophthora palmivora]|uniref:Glutathione S-transferase T3-like isoform X1 n=1 Tax=Phytophthora palmivora TaxID=4796 RepID=A0A2P4YGL4_9STRA|nr:Glutathione S-transferase T3-like isoform X1 [Phytophthora palmivora]
MEDRQLTKAWLDVSKDGIVGTDQSGAQFWERVTQIYNDTRPRQQERYKRHQNAVANRWKAIRFAVGKFCGCYAAVKLLNQSGKTDEDRVQDARSMYEDELDADFEFIEAWRVLREEPTWKAVRPSQMLATTFASVASVTLAPSVSHRLTGYWTN